MVRGGAMRGLVYLVVVISVQSVVHVPYSKRHAGRRVCSLEKSVSQPVKMIQSYCKPAYKTYSHRCLDKQICSGRRLVYETAYRMVYETRVTSCSMHVCCPGWTQHHSLDYGCNKPLCTHSCMNGGTCAKPDTCICPEGYTGEQCEKDVDECKEKPCDHVCTNIKGSFRCHCHDGFDLLSDGRSCRSHEGKTATEAKDLAAYNHLLKRTGTKEKISSSTFHWQADDFGDESLTNIMKKIKSLTDSISILKEQISNIEQHQNEIHLCFENLKEFKTEILQIPALCEQVSSIRKTLSDCNCNAGMQKVQEFGMWHHATKP